MEFGSTVYFEHIFGRGSVKYAKFQWWCNAIRIAAQVNADFEGKIVTGTASPAVAMAFKIQRFAKFFYKRDDVTLRSGPSCRLDVHAPFLFPLQIFKEGFLGFPKLRVEQDSLFALKQAFDQRRRGIVWLQEISGGM